MIIGTEGLIDEIYEASVIPELWPKVLDTISQVSGAAGGTFFTANPYTARWTASEAIWSLMREFVEDGWMLKNLRAPRAIKLNHAGFVTDFDLLTPEELETDPLYVDFLRKRGLGWCTGVTIPIPSGDVLVFTCEREFARGPFEQTVVNALNPLRPHLARAGLISARLGLERAKAAAAALGVLGLPAAVLSHTHRVLAANDLLGGIIPAVVQDKQERVHLSDRRADGLLARALAHLKRPHAPDQVSSIPIGATDEHPAMVAHLVPVRGAAQDIFSLASCVLVVMPVSRAEVPSAEVIQGLFDLTAAEARVAQAVAGGKTLESYAAASGVALGTVRSQLKAVFTKTGLARQADLVSLLAGTILPRG
jgi:DNA-binding CsgD family transcriptional regulator